jgi:hypothetical protein
MTNKQRLFFAGHGDGTLGTDEGADSAAFAEIIIDFNVAGLLVSGNAEIRAKIAAQVTAAAEIVPQAPARLRDRRLLIKTWFDLIQTFSVLIFVPAPDFQFTWFSHSHFLCLTTEALRTQRKAFSFGGRYRRMKIFLCSICKIIFQKEPPPLNPKTSYLTPRRAGLHS